LPETVDGASITAPILSSVGLRSLYHSAVAVSLVSRFFFSTLSEAMTAFTIAFMVGPSSDVSVKKGRMLMRLLADLSQRMVLTSEFGCAPPVSI